MDNIFKNKDRRVLPNWRSFKDTIISNELNSNKKNNEINFNSIEDYCYSFKIEKSIATAGDLISSAYVNGVIENEQVQDAAEYIIINRKVSTPILIDLSLKIKDFKNEKLNYTSFIQNRNEFEIKNQIISLIKSLKPKINEFSNNPIYYVELSRLFTILGNKDKSIKNMKIALMLARENRFVLRAASRLFSHYNLHEYIHTIIKNTQIIKYDPWVASAELALATMLNIRSNNLKNGFKLVNSKNFSPFQITELASSLGTLEYFNGDMKKTKKLIMESIISPNDNSLAQFEWLKNKESFFDLAPHKLNISNNYEAQALVNYFDGNFTQSLENINKWFLDLPFSSRPIKLGYHISGTIMKDSKTAIDLLKLGFLSHPKDPFIINNLSYQFALVNNLKDAEKFVNLQDIEYSDDIEKICIIATKGLIFFRKGDVLRGRQLYHYVLEKTLNLPSKEYYWLAYLNLLREELLINSDLVSNLSNGLKGIPDKTSYIQVNQLKSDILKMFQNKIKL